MLAMRQGWTEVNVPADVDPAVTLVAAPDLNTRIIVRRIRGTVSNAFSLRSSTTVIQSLSAGNVDIPGLQLATRFGEDLTAFGSGVSDTGDVAIQYAFDRNPQPQAYT